ncbi:hypothetical protein JKP88DRAFT_283885 [Tribonema minus]|uniref:Uncharacterized protein n=1 Tax=Tribonema minus TaxID=303371 RepID=A0A836C6P0_9STRA|nr:hypothetical protein JKP88DRAFT_283885 [Tribonema minus]
MLGMGAGHSFAGSNWHIFMRYSGVRAVRQLAGVSSGTEDSETFNGFAIGSQNFGRALDGTFNITDRNTYNAAVTQLRTLEGRDPSYDGWVVPPKWNQIEKKLAVVSTGETSAMSGSASANQIVYQDLGLRTMKLFAMGCNAKFVFANASLEDELFNEPDLQDGYSCHKDATQFAETYVLRSRAIQDAYDDYSSDASAGLVRCPVTNVTAVRNCILKPLLHIAAFADGVRGYYTDPKKLVAVRGWNREFPYVLNTTYADPALTNIQAYDYHVYGKEGYLMIGDASTVSGYIKADYPKGLPLVISEVNAHLPPNWEINFLDQDAPQIASKLGGQLLTMMSIGVIPYVYKFSTAPQTIKTGQDIVTKNGLFWGENYEEPYNIGDSALGGETVRLLALHAQDSHMYPTASSGLPKTVYALAVREGGSADGAYYYMYLINTAAGSAVFDVDLSAWSAWVGGDILTTCVNGTAWSEVLDIRPVPQERILRDWTLPAKTTQLLAVPARPLQLVRRTPVADLHVRGGANADGAYGDLPWLGVGTSARSRHESTFVTLMRFAMPESTAPGAVQAAVLSLVTYNNASIYEDNILQVLCLSPALWDGHVASWSGLSNLETAFLKPAPTEPITSIADNFIKWPSDSRKPSMLVGGHIYLPANATAGTTRQLDLAQCVRTMGGTPGGQVDVLIYRPYRRNAAANVVTGDRLSRGAVIKFYSSEAEEQTFRPTMSWYI